MFGDTDAPPGKKHPERDQDEAEDEDDRDQKEDDDADVGIAGVPSNLSGQNEQPREARGGYQRDAQHADPVTGEQHEYGMFRESLVVFEACPFRIRVRIVHADLNFFSSAIPGRFPAPRRIGRPISVLSRT